MTRGRLSKHTSANRYRAVEDSDDVARPFEEFDFDGIPDVVLGRTSFEGTRVLVRIDGEDLFSIDPPDESTGLPRLNGRFHDFSEKETIRIVENVWEGPVDAWDVVVKGRMLTIRSDEKRVALAIEVLPPRKVVVHRLNMYYKGCHILIADGDIRVGHIVDGRGFYLGVDFGNCVGAETAIDFQPIEVSPTFEGVSIVGNGIELRGTGVRLAVGASSMTVGNLRVW